MGAMSTTCRYGWGFVACMNILLVRKKYISVKVDILRYHLFSRDHHQRKQSYLPTLRSSEVSS